MKFVLKFEECTSACYPYNVALAWIKFHAPVGFPFLQAAEDHHSAIKRKETLSHENFQ